MKMTHSSAGFGVGLSFAAVILEFAVPGQPVVGSEPKLVLEATIALNQVSGRIDHMAIDLAARRLYVAEVGNDSVDEIDLATKKAVGRIGGLNEPQGISFLPDKELLAVANGGDGKVSFFHAADLSPAGSVALGDDADNLHADAAGKRLVAGYGEGGLAVIDPETRTRIAEIRLPAHPEGFQLNRTGTRAFVNLPDSGQIAAVDLVADRQPIFWPTHWAGGNFPMAMNGIDKVLAVGFRSPATLALIDAGSGALIAQIRSCGDADDIFFDDRRRYLYESCGEGVVDVYDWANSSGLQGSPPRLEPALPSSFQNSTACTSRSERHGLAWQRSEGTCLPPDALKSDCRGLESVFPSLPMP